jgi:hypothetical protein
MLPEKALPQLSMDPFSDESLAEPYAHHDLLRGAGRVFWLECRGIYGAAGHAEVSVALKDSEPLFSSKDMSSAFRTPAGCSTCMARGPTAPMLGFDTNTPVKAQLFEFVRRYRIVPGAVERRNPAWQEGVIDRPEDINSSSSCRLFG